MILTLIAVMVAAIFSFVLFERGRDGAMVPLDIFRNREFSAALAIAGLMTFGMYAMLFLTPLYLQAITGASAFIAGLELMPISLTFVVVSQCSGTLMNRFGARAMLAGGMGCMGGGLLFLAGAATAQPNLWLIQAALIVIGVGLGLNTAPVNAVAVAAVGAARSGTASGLINTTRMIGATMGIAILGAIYASHARTGTQDGMLNGLRFAYLGGAAAEFSGVVIALLFTRRDSMIPRSV
jgi:MFS family permease